MRLKFFEEVQYASSSIMNWNKLLSPVRIKELFGAQSIRLPPQDLRSQFERDYDLAVFSTTGVSRTKHRFS